LSSSNLLLTINSLFLFLLRHPHLSPCLPQTYSSPSTLSSSSSSFSSILIFLLVFLKPTPHHQLSPPLPPPSQASSSFSLSSSNLLLTINSLLLFFYSLFPQTLLTKNVAAFGKDNQIGTFVE
jgi:hypothetical protein